MFHEKTFSLYSQTTKSTIVFLRNIMFKLSHLYFYRGTSLFCRTPISKSRTCKELSPVLDETYDRMVIADVDDAVILYMCDTSNWKPDKLAYRQKQGKVTVFAAPYIPIIHHNDHEFEIPIILFDDFPQAVHAQIELELYSIQDTHAIPHTALPQKFFGEADRKKSGYFCFYIKSPDFSWFGPGKESEEPTLATLCKLTEKSFYRVDPNIILPVTVKLFDSKNQLVYEETVLIRDIVGDAHYRRAEQP